MESGGDAAKAKAVLGHKITVGTSDFIKIVGRMDRPVIVYAKPGSLGFSPTWQYMTSYKGFLFHTLSKDQLFFKDSEMFETKKIA